MPLSKALRPSGALIVVALAIASCNKDFHGVGANLLEEQAFNTQSVRVPAYAYQDATEKVQADGLPLAQLGEIHHPVFCVFAVLTLYTPPFHYSESFGVVYNRDVNYLSHTLCLACPFLLMTLEDAYERRQV